MKQDIREIVSQSVTTLTSCLDSLSNSNCKTLTIDTRFFNQKYLHDVDVTKCEELNIGHLKNIKKPVLYWFELVEQSLHNEAIRKDYIKYREHIKYLYKDPHYRNTSSYKKHYAANSVTLYVGKVESGFWGRLVTHLGYNQSVKTAGMQLFHWYNPNVFGTINLNYMVFEPKMKYHLTMIEKEFSLLKKPLIGIY